jgi:PTH1 family peptidyl-tRNA hydrolase
MKFIVGLGNPGKDYLNTRHNVGFMVIDALPKSSKFKALKSDQFMNESGVFVSKQIKAHHIKPEGLYVVHDDLDIKLGEYKIQFGHGPKDHNGILSIEEELRTKYFWRVRVGVDNRPLDNRPMGEAYVLQNFTNEERVILDKVINEVVKRIPDFF